MLYQLSYPHLIGLWCIIMRQSVMQKDWFAVLKVTVTVRAHIKMSLLLLSLLIVLQPVLMWWYIIICLSVLWEEWIAASKVKVTVKVKNVSERLFGWYVLNHWTFRAAVFEHFSIAAATFPALVLYSFPSVRSRYQVKVTMATVLSPHILSVSVATVLKISGMLQSNRSVGLFKLRGFLSSLTRYLLGCFTWELTFCSAPQVF